MSLRTRMSLESIARVVLLSGLFALVVQPSRAQAQEPAPATPTVSDTAADDRIWTYEGPTMGTTYQIRVLGTDQPELGFNDKSTVGVRVAEALEAVNAAMSTYRPDSEVSLFNSSTSTDWFPVSLATATVVKRAQEVSDASGGAFDITVGPLVNRWSFGPDKDITTAPTTEEIEELLKRVGYKSLEVRLDPPALKKSKPDLYVDLSAIAKGYGVDQAALKLEELGFVSYLVEVGGEVRCRGMRPDGSRWRTGIRRPTQQTLEAVAVVELGSKSIATSGDYENFVLIDGQRYSHTIDPSTGKPVTHQIASVSVVADDCMTADALATAVNVLGYERGQQVVRDFGGTLFVLEYEGEGFKEAMFADFPFVESPIASSEPQATSFLGMAIAAAVVFGIALLGMAIGVMFGRKPITGSCGGLAQLKGGVIPSACEMCGKKTKECSELQEALKKQRPQESAEA